MKNKFIDLNRIQEELELVKISGLKTKINQTKIISRGANRGGLELTGFFFKDNVEKIMCFGSKESAYINSLTKKEVINIFTKIFKSKIPTIITSVSFKWPMYLVELAKKNNFPIFKSKLSYTDTFTCLTLFLNAELAEETHMHATLVQLYGKGVLLMGESGIGKSETTLELIKKGHLFVSDDTVVVKRIGNILTGSGDKITKNLLEVRGIGIINMENMFGSSSIIESSQINYVLNLKTFNNKIIFDRLGAELQKINIKGLEIPVMDIPISAARNISTLVEASIAQIRLKEKGLNPVDLAFKRFKEED